MHDTEVCRFFAENDKVLSLIDVEREVGSWEGRHDRLKAPVGWCWAG
jgi:hypothetical protein